MLRDLSLKPSAVVAYLKGGRGQGWRPKKVGVALTHTSPLNKKAPLRQKPHQSPEPLRLLRFLLHAPPPLRTAPSTHIPHTCCLSLSADSASSRVRATWSASSACRRCTSACKDGGGVQWGYGDYRRGNQGQGWAWARSQSGHMLPGAPGGSLLLWAMRVPCPRRPAPPTHPP